MQGGYSLQNSPNSDSNIKNIINFDEFTKKNKIDISEDDNESDDNESDDNESDDNESDDNESDDISRNDNESNDNESDLETKIQEKIIQEDTLKLINLEQENGELNIMGSIGIIHSMRTEEELPHDIKIIDIQNCIDTLEVPNLNIEEVNKIGEIHNINNIINLDKNENEDDENNDKKKKKNLNKMNLADLKELVIEKGILETEEANKLKKADLIKSLQNP